MSHRLSGFKTPADRIVARVRNSAPFPTDHRLWHGPIGHFAHRRTGQLVAGHSAVPRDERPQHVLPDRPSPGSACHPPGAAMARVHTRGHRGEGRGAAETDLGRGARSGSIRRRRPASLRPQTTSRRGMVRTIRRDTGGLSAAIRLHDSRAGRYLPLDTADVGLG